jgi:hypothetical protein
MSGLKSLRKLQIKKASNLDVFNIQRIIISAEDF